MTSFGQIGALRLRPPRRADEEAFVAAHEIMAAERFGFGLGYRPGMSWPRYLALVEARRVGSQVPEGWVPSTFLLADVDGEIVGRASVRHRLNAHLRREGGHIGYCVLPEHRRRGYATEILRQSLVIARSVGVDEVLVTCDDDNLASARTIERCGGMLVDVVTDGAGPGTRRYRIT